jgi:shikimate dehydrogenase
MRKFGLIGYPLSHSFSKPYFTRIFKEEGIDAVYENYPIEEISLLPSILADPAIEGLNVTIPYKEDVIPYLDELSDAVRQIGACNCIHIQGGKKCGHNTDVTGFERSLLKKLLPHHRDALVLGTGGAAKAVYYVLEKLGIPCTRVSRVGGNGCISYQDLTEELMARHQLVINTTPLGMYPMVEGFPDLPYDAVTPSHYFYDLIYNPAKTIFLQKAEERGAVIENGQDMLMIQADESRKIWKI